MDVTFYHDSNIGSLVGFSVVMDVTFYHDSFRLVAKEYLIKLSNAKST